MLESNLKAVDIDVKTLVKDGQSLLQTAAALSGVKADEMRNRGLQMLDAAIAKANELQAAARASGRDMAVSADGYVKENPWRTMAAAAGVGMLMGLLLSRK